MGIESQTQKKAALHSVTDYAQSIESRQFSTPVPSSSRSGSLQTQLDRADRFGHHLSQVQIQPVQRQTYVQRNVVDEEQERDAEMQMKAIQRHADPESVKLLQRMPDLSPKDSGRSLPKHIQTKMEKSFGTSFSDVQIHEGPQASSVGALAYTQGNRIHFAPGQYNPDSSSGQALLGHELTHVVQQRAGRVPLPDNTGGLPINADPSLEQEADDMGARAARGEPITMPGASGMGTLTQRKKPIQNSQAPVQMFFMGLLLNNLLPPVIKLLFPSQGGNANAKAEDTGE
ncbi:DUF4157 domain-containing protein [Leptolyngbya sp. AN03gr2]|uniref:eCIS core domain-containing protein n=1 Tax=unclassified Leptolyngbya TaxID=2650499 RepID=UPI003D31B88D